MSSRAVCAEAERAVSFENAPKGSIDFPLLFIERSSSVRRVFAHRREADKFSCRAERAFS